MRITAGLPFKTVLTLADHNASDGWSVSGQLATPTAPVALPSALFSGDGTAWTLAIPSSTTAGLSAGNHTLYLVAELDGVEELAMQVPVSVEALGTVSHNAKMVSAIRALMEGRPTSAYETYATEDGESITRMSPESLEKWLRFYEKRLDGEKRIAAGGGRVRTIQMGFGP